MNKALLIAYHYPPLGGPGVFRTLKFTKYLPNFNYQPFILTIKNPMYVLSLGKIVLTSRVYTTPNECII